MNELMELITVRRQRDTLAKFIFEEDDGTLDSTYCLPEMKAGRCPYRDFSYGADRAAQTCVPCIVRLIGGGKV